MSIVSVYAGEEKKKHTGDICRDNGMHVLCEPPFNIGQASLNASDVDPVSESGQPFPDSLSALVRWSIQSELITPLQLFSPPDSNVALMLVYW
jgi:hypothetical protein